MPQWVRLEDEPTLRLLAVSRVATPPPPPPDDGIEDETNDQHAFMGADAARDEDRGNIEALTEASVRDALVEHGPHDGPANDHATAHVWTRETITAALASAGIEVREAAEAQTADGFVEPVRSATPPAPKRRGNFVARHWRGEYSLAVSYWLINLGANLFLLAAAWFIGSALVPQEGYEPVASFYAMLAIWLIITIVLVWQVVGLWRSAERHAEERRRRNAGAFWARVVQVLTVLAVLQNLSAFNTSGRPQLTELYRIAYQGDPDVPPNSLALSADGQTLTLEGGIKYGLAREVDTVLRDAPAVSVVRLNSPGGRIAEAYKIFSIIRNRGLGTFVDGMCASACTLIFVGGHTRTLSAGGYLGFHGADFPGMSSAERVEANEEFSSLYRAAGVEGLFIRRALAVSPDDMWFPTANELKMANVITDFAGVDDSVLESPRQEVHLAPTATIPTLAEIASELRGSSGVIDALAEIEPATAQQIFQYVKDNYEQLASGQSTTVTATLQELAAGAVARHYPNADDSVLVEAAKLLADHSAALFEQSPELCVDYSRGGAAYARAYKMLPADLQSLELEVNEMVLRTSQPRAPIPASRIAAIEEQVFGELAKSLTEHQLAVLGTDIGALLPEDYGHYCIGTVLFYREIANLVPSAAGDLMRTYFAQP